ncbi:hypothetical protein K1719_021826 [Acacia pycnantha]|nr:hypothetical protein K1719_021826 [Acacia pycnantha]
MFLGSYAYIYTSNGVSLHVLAISLSKGRKYSSKDNDDLCLICWDGGNLLLCDGCPRAFHNGYNAHLYQAFHVVTGTGIEQITKRCIRIVKDIEAELSGCALCRGYDFSKSGFGPRTIILCDQCEKEYHVGCLRDHKMAYLKELPEGNWFCCTDCNRIHSTLQKFLIRGTEKLPDSLVDVIKTKTRGKRPLLSEVVSIFHECFDPIVDSTSGRDLIPAMVHGRNVRSQEFGGMYCAILLVNSTVVSTGMLRIFGNDVITYRLLALLNVKMLVLPAAEEAESIWTYKFGFHKMKLEHVYVTLFPSTPYNLISNCRKNYS